MARAFEDAEGPTLSLKDRLVGAFHRATHVGGVMGTVGGLVIVFETFAKFGINGQAILPIVVGTLCAGALGALIGGTSGFLSPP